MNKISYIICMIGIYKITSPSNKIYVGQSTDLKKREENYKNLRCKGQRKLYNSIKKYGWKNHKFEIIELQEDLNILNEKERSYYDLYSEKCEMLNIIIPGKEGNRKHSEETKLLISNKNSKGKTTQFSKLGIFIKVWNSRIEASNNLKISIQSINACIVGKNKTAKGFIFKSGEFHHNIEPVEKRKKAVYIKKPGRRIGTAINQPVYQYDLEGNFIKEWFSIIYAAKELGLNKGCISSVCRGITKQTGGYKWSRNKFDDFIK